jgi:choline kinase
VKAIILAAGLGTRLLPLTQNMQKCLIQVKDKSLLEVSLLSLSKCGVKDAVIIVGHYADQVKERIGNSRFGIKMKYIFNPLYNFHGCQYSLSLAEDEFRDTDVLVMEGDVLLHPKLFSMVLNSRHKNSVLIDTKKQLDATRSVIILGRNGIVEKFVFDPSHQNVFALIDDCSKIAGESLQVWRFSTEASNALADDLRQYKEGLGNEPDLRTNLYSINRVIQVYQMRYIDSQGLPWVNINTLNDIKEVRAMNFEG